MIGDLTEEEFYDEMWREAYEEETLETIKADKIKDEYKNLLSGLINVQGLFKWLEEHDSYRPEGIVDIILTDEKSNGYPNHQHARIVDDEEHLLYMQTNMDEYVKGVKYYFVWQTTGHLGDDFSGILLFPLKNGKFFKVAYWC